MLIGATGLSGLPVSGKAMPSKSRLVFGFCLLFGAAMAGAERAVPRFETLGVEHGLPSPLVTTIAQDRAGYLWFATGDGLARYDGLSMRVWQHDPDDPQTLAANNVQTMLIDSRDRIWAATLDSGLSILSADRRSLRRMRHVPGDPHSLPGDAVWDLVEAADGAIWMAIYGSGLVRLDPDSGQLQHWQPEPDVEGSLPFATVSVLAFDAAGDLWIGGWPGGLARMRPDGRFEHFPPRPEDPEGQPANVIIHLSAEPSGSLWIGGQGGLIERKPDGRFVRRLADGRFAGALAMVHGPGEERWVVTNNGLILWPDRNGPGQFINRRRGTLGSLPSERLWSGYRDHEGGLWFATLDAGIARLRPDWQQFMLYQPVPGDDAGLPEATVRGIAQLADGRLLVGTNNGGTALLDPLSGAVERIAHGPGNDAAPDSRWLPHDRVWAVLADVDGRHWIGHHRGLSIGRPGDWRHWLDQSGGDGRLLGGFVDLLFEAADGSIWVSSHGHGLHRFDRTGRLLAAYPADGRDDLPIGPGRSRQIVEDAGGVLWVGHEGGVDRYDPAQGRFEPWLDDDAGPVYGLAFDAERRLWVLRRGRLSAYVQRNGGLVERLRLGVADGLPAVEAGGLVEDLDGRFWYATPRGLVRLDPSTASLRQFTRADGLPVLSLSDRVPFRAADGWLYFGSTLGVLAFDPRRLHGNPVPPPLEIERISVRSDQGARELVWQSGQVLRLQHGDRDLRIVARALSFADPRANRYAMLLEGYDRDWQPLDAHGERVFGRLPPGQYRLHVTAANNAGVWSTERISLELWVPQPPWRTLPMRLLYAALATAVVLWLLHAWRQRVARRHALQLAEERARWAEAASAAKSRFLANFSHEVRTPMTGLLGMAELLLRTPLQERQAIYARNLQRSGRALLRLMDDILDLSRIEAGQFQLCAEPVSLRGLLEELRDLYAPLAEQQGLEFVLDLAAEVPERVVGDGLRLRQMLENLLRNALKFTRQGRIVLRASSTPGGVALEVEDTGVGIEPEQQQRLFQPFVQADGSIQRRYGGSGLGLVICRELAERMGGRIELHSRPGLGTRLRIELPLQAAAIPISQGGLPGKVLVVEDDAGSAALLLELLREQGVGAEHAGHGLAAMALFSTLQPQLVLLDLDLPELDGMEVARLMRRHESASGGARARIVAVTARTGAGLAEACRAAGIDDVVTKPVSPALLRRVLEGP